jgi:hypothetical protein
MDYWVRYTDTDLLLSVFVRGTLKSDVDSSTLYFRCVLIHRRLKHGIAAKSVSCRVQQHLPIRQENGLRGKLHVKSSRTSQSPLTPHLSHSEVQLQQHQTVISSIHVARANASICAVHATKQADANFKTRY